jgi:hypothetical protein
MTSPVGARYLVFGHLCDQRKGKVQPKNTPKRTHSTLLMNFCCPAEVVYLRGVFILFGGVGAMRPGGMRR